MNTRKSWKSNINNHISSKRVSACQRYHFNRANTYTYKYCVPLVSEIKKNSDQLYIMKLYVLGYDVRAIFRFEIEFLAD